MTDHGHPTPDPAVTNDTDHRRYELRVEDRLAGAADYRIVDDHVVLTHTEIEPEFEERGLGGRLARAALDDIRRQGMTVVPQCPFIAGYIERHDEYADLVHPA